MNYTSINKRIFTSVTSCSKPAIRIKKKKKWTNGYNSKYDWNIVRQLSQNNVEDLYALKNDGGLRLFSEDEIKFYTNHTTRNYTQNTHYQHTKKNIPTR